MAMKRVYARDLASLIGKQVLVIDRKLECAKQVWVTEADGNHVQTKYNHSWLSFSSTNDADFDFYTDVYEPNTPPVIVFDSGSAPIDPDPDFNKIFNRTGNLIFRGESIEPGPEQRTELGDTGIVDNVEAGPVKKKKSKKVPELSPGQIIDQALKEEDNNE